MTEVSEKGGGGTGGVVNVSMDLQERGPLILGVTGGIATGKSTVARMLQELGAPIIDFDRISRQVIEPGQPAWKEIRDHFGKRALQADGELDRKRLSNIVFQDPGKRKELERITHPRITEEFLSQLGGIARQNPDAVVQAVIPLLIEVNLQHLVHKVLVVYISRDKQIERLSQRDGITRAKAELILEAQMPIDEKLAYADFVVNNEYSRKETEKQVKELWKELQNIKEQRG